MPGCSNGFMKAEIPLRERGVIQYSKIGEATVQIMKAENVVDIVLERPPPGPAFHAL